MDPFFILLLVGVVSLMAGSIMGYYARQSIAKKKLDTIELKLKEKISQTKAEAEKILAKARREASQILEKAKKEENERRQELLKRESLLFKRENLLTKKVFDFRKEEEEFQKKVQELKKIKENLEKKSAEAQDYLKKISGLSPSQAKKELFANLEKEYQAEILERIKKLEDEGIERYEKRAKELLALAIQKCAISQAQEITTTTVNLPSDEIKGRIIGKEGRNIRTLEKLTGCEIIIDETPETVMISCFDPIRRQIAKLALERLIQDGRIQPVRIEEIVQKTQSEINSQIKEAGEAAVYETGIVDLHPRLVQLLGRLKFRTSYGQNVLLHSIEVAHLAETLASELGANATIAKKAGLLHDIGKAIDRQVEGSHVDIGIKILEKFGAEPEVITAMKSHHEEYPYESLEAIIVQVADQISGARPGARKDTLENYLKRLSDLENIATSFSGVEKAWALQAGREIRVFVRPEEVDDLSSRKLAREIANRIQEELRYPGEIKVTLIRESRVVEYAR